MAILSVQTSSIQIKQKTMPNIPRPTPCRHRDSDQLRLYHLSIGIEKVVWNWLALTVQASAYTANKFMPNIPRLTSPRNRDNDQLKLYHLSIGIKVRLGLNSPSYTSISIHIKQIHCRRLKNNAHDAIFNETSVQLLLYNAIP